MKYWVRLDKERIMADYNEDDLACDPWDSVYLIRQLRFLVQRGEAAFPAEDQDILHGQGMVNLTDNQGRSVYTPCVVIAPVGEVYDV